MNLTIKGCDIDGGVLNGAAIGKNNKVVYGSGTICEDNDINKFIGYMDEVIVNSDNKNERECALRAKKVCGQKDKSSLKDYLIDNMSTFVTGTFANVAGGALIELIKKLIR